MCSRRRGTPDRACTSTAAASWTTTDDGALVFVEKEDQRVWILPDGDGPRPLTPPDGGMRFGGLTWQGGRLLAIRETHGGAAPPHRDIVEVPLDRRAVWDASAIVSLTEDSDFLAQPALSLGRLASRLDRLGSPEHAVGHDGAAGRAHRRRRRRGVDDDRRRATAPRRSSRCGPARTTSSTATTRAAAGTCGGCV